MQRRSRSTRHSSGDGDWKHGRRRDGRGRSPFSAARRPGSPARRRFADQSKSCGRPRRCRRDNPWRQRDQPTTSCPSPEMPAVWSVVATEESSPDKIQQNHCQNCAGRCHNHKCPGRHNHCPKLVKAISHFQDDISSIFPAESSLVRNLQCAVQDRVASAMTVTSSLKAPVACSCALSCMRGKLLRDRRLELNGIR